VVICLALGVDAKSGRLMDGQNLQQPAVAWCETDEHLRTTAGVRIRSGDNW
jgi:hypothetical protein